MNRLISLLCTMQLSPAQAEALRDGLGQCNDWPGFVAQTTQHRLLPLAYWHVREWNITVPAAVSRVLVAAYLRHKSIAQAQFKALHELAEVLHTARIPFVVLKGGALAPLLYPEPGLRPMDDLDILVRPEEADTVRMLMQSLGYEAPAAQSRFERLQHHLPMMQRLYHGHLVGVEIHTEVFNLILNQPLGYADLKQPLGEFYLGSECLRCMNPEQLLWMQYLGLRKLAEPLSYLHLLDLVALIERYANSIDWQGVRSSAPDVWHALRALDEFRPIHAPARPYLGLPEPPPDTWRSDPTLGVDYSAWPRDADAVAGRPLTLGAQLGQLLCPPAWWARFFYGLPAGRWTRARISQRHAATYLGQGLRRLYLGPAKAHRFFTPRAKPQRPLLPHTASTPASTQAPVHARVRPDESSAEVGHAADARVCAPTTRTAGHEPALPLAAAGRVASHGTTVFVTCIYNGLAGTRFGGRLNRNAMYRESLCTIAGCGVKIVCYVSPDELHEHQAYFSTRAPNIELQALDLTDIPCSPAIQAIKAQHPHDFTGHAWQERCVEIMWGKFHFLQQTLMQQPSVSHLFWIDAGLANVNIISTCYISEADLCAYRLSEVQRAFPPALVPALQAFAGERVLALKCTQAHNPGIPEHYNQRPYPNPDALIGGLFGGRRSAVAALCKRFDAKAQRILADKRLFFEESIMTGIHADEPALFATFSFDTWYHEGWAQHDPSLVNFSQFFDQMLGTPKPTQRLTFPWNG